MVYTMIEWKRPNGTKAGMGMLVAFLVLVASASFSAIAGNVDNAEDTSRSLSVTRSNALPVITNFEFVDSSSFTSILDSQTDVNTALTMNVTVEDTNGWDDVDAVIIYCYYDGGTDQDDLTGFADQTTGENYKFMLEYDNTASDGNGESAPSTDHMSVNYSDSADNTLVSEQTHSVAEITANQKYKLTWNFTLGYQFKQADAVDAGDATSYANANSWNIHVNASDATDTTSQKDDGSDAYEFGIYQYTYVDAGSNDWDVGTVSPGGNSDATASSVTTRSNDDFNFSVAMEGDLSSGDDTIPTSGGYITLLADASETDDVTSDTSFSGNSQKEWILLNDGYGDHSEHRAASNESSTDVNFNIEVPVGTLPGTYTAALTFLVDQVN